MFSTILKFGHLCFNNHTVFCAINLALLTMILQVSIALDQNDSNLKRKEGRLSTLSTEYNNPQNLNQTLLSALCECFPLF